MIMKNNWKILNDYFDKIYIITLHRAADRQEKVKHLFEGVNFEFFFGVDKLNLNMAELVATNMYDPKRAKKLHINNKEMPVGHIACSLSHKELYKEILQQGHEKVLIMEDDFMPADIPENIIREIITELPDDWELVYWGYYLNEKPIPRMQIKNLYYLLMAFLRIIKLTPSQVVRLYPKKYSQHILKAGFHNTTHAYALKKSALAKLIDAQTPVVLNADTLLSRLILDGKLKAYLTVPKVFEQEIFMENGNKFSYISN